MEADFVELPTTEIANAVVNDLTRMSVNKDGQEETFSSTFHEFPPA